jgi:uncharacterized membrane protein
MDTLILIIVVIGILFVIASGVWVATALISAISAPRDGSGKKNRG